MLKMLAPIVVTLGASALVGSGVIAPIAASAADTPSTSALAATPTPASAKFTVVNNADANFHVSNSGAWEGDGKFTAQPAPGSELAKGASNVWGVTYGESGSTPPSIAYTVHRDKVPDTQIAITLAPIDHGNPMEPNCHMSGPGGDGNPYNGVSCGSTVNADGSYTLTIGS